MLSEIEIIDDVAVVAIEVDVLDASNTKEFKSTIKPLLKEHPRMVLDLSQVSFMDSSGLGALLSCLRQLNSSGGDLKLYGVTPPVRALLELVRMHKIVDITNDREEAIKAFSA